MQCTEAQRVQHDEIVEHDNYRKRVNPKKDAELTESVAQYDVLQPVCLRPRPDGKFDLVFGSRRFRASKAAGKTSIPAIIRNLSDDEVRFLQLVENGERQDAHPLEEAEAFKSLLDRGHSVEDIAARVVKSPNHVRLRLKLCDLVEEARNVFFEEQISTQVAYLLARLADPDDQRKALEAILQAIRRDTPMSANQVHALIEHNFLLQLQNAPFDTRDGSLLPETGPCGPCPKHTGNQKDLFGDFSTHKPMCTDARCFNQKSEAAYLRKADAALAKGHEVLSPEESAKLFPNGSFLPFNSPYVDLNSVHPIDPQRRTYRQLLRRRTVPQFLALDSFHRTHDLALKADIEQALQDAAYDFLAAKRDDGHTARERDKETRKQMAEARGMLAAALQAIVAGVETKEPDTDFWRILVTGLVQGSWHDTIAELVKRRGLHIKGTRPEEVLTNHLEKADASELRGIAFELAIRRGCHGLTTTAVFRRAAGKYAPQPAAEPADGPVSVEPRSGEGATATAAA